MLRVRLPFPDRKLNPNARRVWQASLKPKKEAREVGYWAARDDDWSGVHERITFLCFDTAKPLRLRIAIHPPDNRRRDWVNVARALKPYEDGIFDYIGLDDSMVKHVDIRWRRSCPDGMVRYILYQT